MKIKKLKLENFAKFTKFEIEFDNKITHLVGINGAGKTTVGLTAIWACLKGIAEKSKGDQLIGERFRFIGNNKATADIELTLIDEQKNDAEIKVKNHITKQSNQITFEAPKNYLINENWLNNLLSVAFLSAKNFTQLNSKEQALLLGIDTSKFDSEIANLKSEYTSINRQLRSYGELIEIPKTEHIDISNIIKFNDVQKEKYTKIEKAKDRLTEIERETNLKVVEIKKLESQLEQCKNELKELDSKKEKGIVYIDELPKPKPLKDITETTEQNRKADEYKAYIEKKKEKDQVQIELDENKSKQSKKEKERVNYIKSFNFGFDGLSVDENGGLLLNERPIKDAYFSKGELELIVANLYKSLNPDLKIRFIDDFELLDEDNQEKILKSLFDAGFQVITARVGKESKDSNSILLRECKIITKNKTAELF